MSEDLVLARLDRARVALYEASTIPDVKRFVDLAATAETWARQQKLGEEIVGYARAFKVDALRRLGELIEGGQESGQLARPGDRRKCSDKEHLDDLGIDRKTSMIAQQLAALPEAQFEAVKEGVVTIQRVVREARRDERIAELARVTPDMAASDLRPVPLLYADPPWRYEHPISDSRKIENQYPTLSLEEIKRLPVSKLATDDAVLFMWATNPKLEEALEVVNAWGFRYRTCFVWVKTQPGMGYWARQRHELLLVATRGNPPVPPRKPDSVIEAPRGKHSEKPEKVYEMLEGMWPEWTGMRRELFARKRRDGWLSWGNEVSS